LDGLEKDLYSTRILKNDLAKYLNKDQIPNIILQKNFGGRESTSQVALCYRQGIRTNRSP
jgi:hypothetical protein